MKQPKQNLQPRDIPDFLSWFNIEAIRRIKAIRDCKPIEKVYRHTSNYLEYLEGIGVSLASEGMDYVRDANNFDRLYFVK